MIKIEITIESKDEIVDILINRPTPEYYTPLEAQEANDLRHQILYYLKNKEEAVHTKVIDY